MLGSGKTGAVRAFVTASSAGGPDADLYRRYAAGAYRQALLTRGGRASAEHLAYDVIVNERALARIPERGEDDARYRLTESVLRRCQRLARGAVAIHPRDMAATLRAVMHRLASSPAAVAEDGSQVRTPACSGMGTSMSRTAKEQEENDANTRIHHDDHHGSRRSGAGAGGGQIAAGCAAVPDDEENLVT